MTLALLLLIATSWMSSPQSSQATAPTTPQSGAETSNPAAQNPDPTQSAPANSSPEAKPQTQPAKPSQKSSTTKRPHHKQKPASVNCDSGATASSSAPNPNASNGGASAAADPPAPNTTATATKNCPPTKIIVRQGGTSQPSIQLAPGNDQAARKRDVVNQLLGATDGNLKRIAGKQLDANQQSTLGQIRDYEQQARAAMGDGDLERARTLAWKAELLSEDLIKPQK